MKKSVIHTISKIVFILCVIIFIIGSTTGTISGYQGADGSYFSDLGAVGSNEWMCMPSLIVGVISFIVMKSTKTTDD